jgi:hypothetical protein
MADINPGPVVDYGNMIAGVGQTQAQTALTQQQTQGANIANQSAALQLGLFRQAVSRLNNFSGQGGPTADVSGVVNAPGSSAPPTDDIGSSAITDPAHTDAALRARYAVSPAGTPQEQAQIIAAHMSGNKGLADAMQTQRDMNVQQRLFQSQYDANNHYESAMAVTDADPGRAFAQLQAVTPNTAKQIQQQNPSATPEELDEIARDSMAHFAGQLHQYTGRGIDKRDDGVYVDSVTKMPVPSVPVSD